MCKTYAVLKCTSESEFKFKKKKFWKKYDFDKKIKGSSNVNF